MLHTLALAHYERMIGLDLHDLAVDGCITQAPGGGDTAGRSPVDWGTQRLKRSIVSDGAGVPLKLVSAGVNRHDAPVLAPTVAGLANLGPLPAAITTHLDRGYDRAPPRTLLDHVGFTGAIAPNGVPAPVQADQRWVVERTHAWMNGYGNLWRCTERNGRVVDFYLFLAAALVVVRALIHRARRRYRWPSRPTTRRLT